jgi:hypothetical protein
MLKLVLLKQWGSLGISKPHALAQHACEIRDCHVERARWLSTACASLPIGHQGREIFAFPRSMQQHFCVPLWNPIFSNTSKIMRQFIREQRRA